MTNREMLIKSLSDDFDDWAPWKWDQLKICGPCILKWLDEEVAY